MMSFVLTLLFPIPANNDNQDEKITDPVILKEKTNNFAGCHVTTASFEANK